MEIGNQIAAARHAAGLSQSQLAEATGRSANTIQAWEHGRRHPRPAALELLAEALGVSVASFYATVSPDREAA
jgi:transcriptional regulator with XRE-family HTH domain